MIQQVWFRGTVTQNVVPEQKWDSKQLQRIPSDSFALALGPPVEESTASDWTLCFGEKRSPKGPCQTNGIGAGLSFELCLLNPNYHQHWQQSDIWDFEMLDLELLERIKLRRCLGCFCETMHKVNNGGLKCHCGVDVSGFCSLCSWGLAIGHPVTNGNAIAAYLKLRWPIHLLICDRLPHGYLFRIRYACVFLLQIALVLFGLAVIW